MRRFGMGSLMKVATSGGAFAWAAKWTDAKGHRHRKILSTDKRVAERVLAKTIRDRDLQVGGLGDEEAPDQLLAALMAEYLADLATFRRPKYVRAVRLHLDALMADLGAGTRVRDVTVPRMLLRRQKRLAEELSHRSINAEAGALRTALRWCVSAGRIPVNPIANLRPLPETADTKVKVRRALSDDEIGRLLAAADQDDADRASRFAAEKTIASGVLGKAYAGRKRMVPIPQAPLIKTLVVLGLRYNEAATLTWNDVDLDGAVVTVRAENAKTHRRREVPVPGYLVEDLRGLRQFHVRALGRAADRVFLSPKQKSINAHGNPMRLLLARLLERAGIGFRNEDGSVAVDIHALRHTSGSRLARHGVPITAIAACLGHSSVVTTQRYVSLRVEDTRRAVEGVPEIQNANAQGSRMTRPYDGS